MFIFSCIFRRINPFDESSVDVMHETAGENAAFSQPFTVRFCGSMEVNSDRGMHNIKFFFIRFIVNCLIKKEMKKTFFLYLFLFHFLYAQDEMFLTFTPV